MWNKPLPYNPKLGEVLRCDYSGLLPGEMAKVRWVVVVSPKSTNTGRLCTVVPISTTAPYIAQHWQVELDQDPYPKGSGARVWAKCDMIMRVSFARLTAYYDGRTPDGKRNYVNLYVSDDELKRIQAGVLHSLGLGHVIKDL
jgi:uncharacterized protein YifN (PemK superfamily)